MQFHSNSNSESNISYQKSVICLICGKLICLMDKYYEDSSDNFCDGNRVGTLKVS